MRLLTAKTFLIAGAACFLFSGISLAEGPSQPELENISPVDAIEPAVPVVKPPLNQDNSKDITDAEILDAEEEIAALEDNQPDLTLTGAYLAARVAGARRNIPAAADFYREAYELHGDEPELLINTFLLELADGRFEPAMELAEKLVATGDDSFARLALGVKALKSRRYKEAEKHFTTFTGEPFGEVVQTLMTAWTQAADGKTDEALETLGDLEGASGVEVFKTYHAGLIASLAGQKDIALARLEKAWNGDSNTLRMTLSYASALSRADRFEDAENILLGFMAANAQHPQIVAALESVQDKKMLPPPVKNATAGAAEVLYGLGSSIGRGGAEEISALYLQLALYLDENAELGRMALASIYESLDLFERSAEVYEGLADDSPLKATAEIRLGILYERLENPDEADRHMEALIEQDPANLEAVMTYGNILRFRQDFEKAVTVYDNGIATIEDVQPEHWQIYYHRGISLERTKQWDRAEQDFLKALELFPDQPDVLNYLGYTWVDMGINLERAVGMLEKAVELRPQAGHIVDSLGWVYYKLGRYEEAVEILERAVIMVPSEPVIHDHLGDAYWMVGRRLEARFQWSHARDLEPDDEELLKTIADKLENGLNTEAVKAAEKHEDEDTNLKAE
jgi:tetratricopeptide (TPR) repeat protein